ncbi:MAG: hypothetical protein P8Y66_08175 [Nitrospirota bacterium]|jgi:hypothetical protein
MTLWEASLSWQLPALFALALGVSFLSFVPEGGASSRWLSFLLESWPGIVLLSSFLLSLTLYTAAAAVRSLSVRGNTPEEMEIQGTAPLPAGGMEDVTGWMRRKGFRPRALGEAVHATRGRYAFLPGTVFRCGLVLALGALLVSHHVRRTEKAWFHEGTVRSLLGQELRMQSIHAVSPGEILVEPGKTGSVGFREVSARVHAGGKDRVIGNGLPRKVGDRWLRITHTGYYQPLSVLTADARHRLLLYLDLLPPGRRKTVRLKPEGMRLLMALAPEKPGSSPGVLYDPGNPRYSLTLEKASGEADRAYVRPGEHAALGGALISLGRHALFVEVRSVRDPALLWLYAGIGLAALGLGLLPLRLFWFRRSLSARAEGGAVLVGLTQELYRKRASLLFRLWMWELEGEESKGGPTASGS